MRVFNLELWPQIRRIEEVRLPVWAAVGRQHPEASRMAIFLPLIFHFNVLIWKLVVKRQRCDVTEVQTLLVADLLCGVRHGGCSFDVFCELFGSLDLTGQISKLMRIFSFKFGVYVHCRNSPTFEFHGSNSTKHTKTMAQRFAWFPRSNQQCCQVKRYGSINA